MPCGHVQVDSPSGESSDLKAPCARGAVKAKLRLRGCFHIGQRQFMSKYNLLLYDNPSVFCCAKSTSPCTGEAKSWTRLKMPVILSACEGSPSASMLHRSEILRRFPLRFASLQRQIARFPRVPALLRMTIKKTDKMSIFIPKAFPCRSIRSDNLRINCNTDTNGSNRRSSILRVRPRCGYTPVGTFAELRRSVFVSGLDLL